VLSIVEQAMENGLEPDAIAFVSFTKAAIREAKERAITKFSLEEKALPYFRTVHSLAFREMGITRQEVLGEDHLTELADATGELIKDINPHFDAPAVKRNADELLTIDHFARTTRQTLEDAWHEHGGEVDWHRLKRFSQAYYCYKEERGLYDFTDMLSAYVDSEAPPPKIRLAIVDEAQDLTRLQWAVIEKAFAGTEELYAAGDDLQSIHKWAGAAEDYFLSLPFERQVLPLSHRLPVEIFNFAEEVAARVSRRYAKDWRSSGRPGVINWVSNPEEVDLSSGTWLLLARTRAQLAALASVARDQGVMYTVKGDLSVKLSHVVAIKAYEALRSGKRVEVEGVQEALKAMGISKSLRESGSYTAAELGINMEKIWHDALVEISLADREYYLACRRRGEKLDGVPRIRVETIHGAKGAEAEKVLLTTDLTYRTHRGYELDPDSEHRVFYVGLTRASQELHLVTPRSSYGFPL
jgi:superfamily I DNA/RNA helicase